MSKLYCDYCKNQYNEKNRLPLILPCNHNICKSCLNKHKKKNIFFCYQCNKKIILPNNNLKPNQKILKKLGIKYQDKDISNNKSNLSSNNENEEGEEEEQEEDEENEDGEEELDEENEEGEEEEDEMEQTDEILEENTEKENDNSENDENKNNRNDISKTKNDKDNSQIDKMNNNKIRKSILKKNSKYINQKHNKSKSINKKEKENNSDNSYIDNNIQNNKKIKGTKNRKSRILKNMVTQDIGASRVNFTSEASSQNISGSNESEIKEKEESEEENNNSSNISDNSNKNDSKMNRSKKSSRKGTDFALSNRNSMNKKKENKIIKEKEKEIESESIPPIEGNDLCIKHKDKQIEFFCSDCSCAICSLCIYEVHNGHKLDLLEDISGLIKKKMGEFYIKIQDIIKINKDNKFNCQKRKDEVNDYLKQQTNIVNKSFKEINNKLEEKKNIIISEFKNKYNHEFNRLDQIKMAIDNEGKEMEKINNLIDNKIKSFNSISDAKILKDFEKYKKFFREKGLDCGKLQKKEIAIKSDLSIDPAMKPITVNINGLLELLNKVDARNICYPKVIGILKEENDININNQKNIGKNEYNLRNSQSNSFIGMNNYSNNAEINNNMNNINNINNKYKIIEEEKYLNEIDNFYNNKMGLNQSHLSNIKNRFSSSKINYLENNPLPNIKYKNYNNNLNNNINNKLSQNELSDSVFGEYGPPNHNRGKYLHQLEMTPTVNFLNVKRSSKYGNIKESQNSLFNTPNNNININNNNYVNGNNYNGNYNENIKEDEETAIFKENGFDSRGSEYSNLNNKNYNFNQSKAMKRERNKSFGSLKDINNNNDSILTRKNMLILKERNPSAGLPLKMNEANAIILPKIMPLPQSNHNSSKKNIRINSKRNNNISNSNSEKSNKEIEDSVYFFGEGDYCLKFYLKRKEWEIINYTTQLSRQIGLLRYSGICSLPSYRIILSGGCKRENDNPSNIFLLINSKNINDVKNLKNIPKKRYFHGCIFLNNNIYIIGGYDHFYRNNAIPSTLKSVERYNISKNQWQNLHGLNEARACFGQCLFNGQIFVFGGLYNESALQSIEKYDEESNVWSIYHIKLPMKLSKIGIINLDNKNILVIGGNDENFVPINNVFKCKLDSDSDKNVWSNEQEMICPRATGNTCFLWNKNIFVFGGSSTNYFEKYDLNIKNWEAIENFYPIINSSNIENIITNYSCALNHYPAFP